MGGDIIKEYLVGLGFGIDEAGLAKFNKAILSASTRVTALYASVKVLAAGIFWSISKISEGFEQMGYEYRIIAPAINKTLILRREMLKAYKSAGVSIVDVIQKSIKFNMSLAKTQMAFKAIFGSVAAKFFPLLTKQMDIFRNNIYKNMPKIQVALEKFVKVVFKAFEFTVQLGTTIWRVLQRVYDFFYLLHEKTNGWSTVIMAVIAAWKLLNLSFLATPLGMIIAALVGLLLLLDDFLVWREKGKSMFDWTSFIPVIDSVTNVLKSMGQVLDNILGIMIGIGFAIYQTFTGQFDSAYESAKMVIERIKGLVNGMLSYWKNAFKLIGSVGGWAGQLFGGDAPVPTQEQWAKFGQVGTAAPLGANVSNQQNTNQNVQQQTTISVSAGADANATAAAVANQQSRVNFDMVRNMKGSTR